MLLQVLSHVCHSDSTDHTQILVSLLASTGSQTTPNWKDGPKFPLWALIIRQAAQSLIDQVKEYTVTHGGGLTKSNQSASSTDHGRVLCIWKLYFATLLVKHLYACLGTSKGPIEGVTMDDCQNMLEEIRVMTDPIFMALGVDNLRVIMCKCLNNIKDVVIPDLDAQRIQTVVTPVLDVQKLRECIANEPIDITFSVKAITYAIGEDKLNLIEFINKMVCDAYVNGTQKPVQLVLTSS
ncbi:hypothetical protein H4219_003650 [Mycoemilia scoparia]|uniref:Uncharacterized protein n=1 Tax=Mycoemilia scoparia TaxID=417184 RepID=A0A9W8DT28_9FUNG|nr:hypothetical protein H4219_003650 [Mycoemilia scoparia]